LSKRTRQLDALREMVYSSFPPVVYNGAVIHDGEDKEASPWPEELDDDEDLFQKLKGRQWTNIVSVEFFQRHPDGYVLLSDQAFAAFLPAWLLFSLEDEGGGGEPREYLTYMFRDPQKDGDSPNLRVQLDARQIRRVLKLNALQRETLRAIIKDSAEHHPSNFVRDSAATTLARLEKLERDLDNGVL